MDSFFKKYRVINSKDSVRYEDIDECPSLAEVKDTLHHLARYCRINAIISPYLKPQNTLQSYIITNLALHSNIY